MKLAPLGDPMELRIHGYELTLRVADAEKIRVVPVEKEEETEMQVYEASEVSLVNPPQPQCKNDCPRKKQQSEKQQAEKTED